MHFVAHRQALFRGRTHPRDPVRMLFVPGPMRSAAALRGPWALRQGPLGWCTAQLRMLSTARGPDFFQLLGLSAEAPEAALRVAYQRAALESLLRLPSGVTQQRFEAINTAFRALDPTEKARILSGVTGGETDDVLACLLLQRQRGAQVACTCH